MSFDISWLWNTLQGVVGSIQSWFSSLWNVAQSITNAGQGIFSGLASIGSMLWDAINRFAQTIGSWFYNAYQTIYNGIIYFANTFGQFINNAFSWIGSGISWIAQQIYNFGQWLYNGLVWIWNMVSNIVSSIWNTITQFFSGIASAVGSWWNNVISGVNSWFTNLIIRIRSKIVNTIIADVSIFFGWKSIERMISSRSFNDICFSLLGLLGSPIAGYIFANIVDKLIPMPSTSPINLIPEISTFTYSPPSMTVPTPIEKTAPTLGTTPPAVVIGAGLPFDITLSIIRSPTVDYTLASSDFSLGIIQPPAYDYSLETTDLNLTMPTIYFEAEVS